jgi:sugar transferase (PEP-CTERM/EpsH1 system associated)
MMKRPTTVLHVMHAFSHGGLENGVVNIINESPAHFVHELCFLSEGGDFLQRLKRPVRYHELHRREGNSLELILKLRNLFRRPDIDVVHTRNWATFDGVLAACLTPNRPLIHSEHGRDMSDPHGVVKRRNVARRILSFRPSKFVAVSQDLYRWLQDTVRVPHRKLMLIQNGVDTERFRPQRNVELRRQLGIGEDEFVVGTIGRLDTIKNHEGLIEAVKDINQGNRKVRLVIVGEGPNRPALEALVTAFPAKPAPLLAGYKPDIETYYGMFDSFVLNSHAEGMSNTLLEAMACELPVVCTSVGGNTELVVDGVRGTLIPAAADAKLASAILSYVESPQLRRTHGTNARRFVEEHFSLARMVRQYVELYESVA